MQYSWQSAHLNDIDAMMEITQSCYLAELNSVLTIDIDKLAETVAHSIVCQSFRPNSAFVQTIQDQDKKIVGWTWLGRGGTTDYIREEVAEAHMLHLDLALSARDRIRLVRGTLDRWIRWCVICQIPILASTTVREQWQPFMNLHLRRGFLVRGSHAFYDVRKEADYVQ